MANDEAERSAPNQIRGRARLSPRDRIREAALASFARRGIAASSVRDIAVAAGVSPGLVQHHFKTKDELREAVNEHVIALVDAAFADFPSGTTPAAVQAELGDRVTALVREEPLALRYVARLAADGDRDAVGIFDAFVGTARRQWERLGEAGLLRDGVDLEWAALHAVVLNLGTVLFEGAIDNHLPGRFRDPEQLQRWNEASSALFQRGIYAAAPEGGDDRA